MNPSSPESSKPIPESGSLINEILVAFRQIPNKGFFLLLLVPWLALFQFLGNSTFGYIDTPSLFAWMWGAYNVADSEDGHGSLIPFVVLGLLWWKRDKLQAVPCSPWPYALALVGVALAMHSIGYVIQQPRISIVSFFLGLYGFVGQVWGRHLMKAVLFPFVLFVFNVPLGSLAELITVPLRIVVTQLSVGISQGLLGIDVIREGSQIFDANHTFRYDVAPACSGIRSLISLVVLSTIYGAITFNVVWKRWLLVVLAVPFAVAGNVFRITGVIVAAEAFGQNAGQMVEQKLGFVTFIFAIGLMLLTSRFIRDSEPGSNPPKSGPTPPRSLDRKKNLNEPGERAPEAA